MGSNTGRKRYIYNTPNTVTVNIEGHVYRVTLMTGADADPATGTGGEWNDLLYPLHVDDPDGAGWEVGYTNEDIGVGNDPTESGSLRLGRGSWCQEIGASDSATGVIRGITTISFFTLLRSHNNTTSNGWRPCLRLV